MSGSYFSEDTIVAVATSLAGDGGVGIIRLSGPCSLQTAQAVTVGLEEPQPRYMHRIEVVQRLESGQTQIVDDGLGVYFPQQHSFTGEEVVELQTHGGRFLLQTILKELISTQKCRLALAGEFSFRAVRNGKMSLGGAAAIGQIVGAKSMFELQAARKGLSVRRRQEFEEIAGKIRDLLAQTELSIDFIDQDVEVISAQKMSQELRTLLEKLDGLLRQMHAAQRIAKGLLVALTGAPNAGKSTLFNALLAEDRAIVSAEAGTTRDVITEEIVLGPYYVRLADTAGVRAARGEIEKQGIERAIQLACDADLVLMVVDGTLSDDELLQNIAVFGGTSVQAGVLILNKWDAVTEERKARLLRRVQEQFSVLPVCVSASAGNGIDQVLAAIRERFNLSFGIGVGGFLPTEFQLQMLAGCKTALLQAQSLIEHTGLRQPELISVSLHGAARAISDLVGETTPDAVLTKIFSEFCIGK